jgi:Ser/Thr protein kinase RdoA (MazF antagonist)
VLEAASRFRLAGIPARAAPLPGGHIHDSFTVNCDQTGRRYLVQRVNTQVFTDPDALVHNFRIVSALLARDVAQATSGQASGPERRGHRPLGLAGEGGDRFVPRLVETLDGHAMWQDVDGGCWRVFNLIDGCRSRDTVSSPREARQVGRAYGAFHRAMLDLDPAGLVPVLPELHDMGVHLAQLRETVALDAAGRVSSSVQELDAVESSVHLVERSEELARRCGGRVVHGDAKVANVLLDDGGGRAVCVVDLDTVRLAPLFTDFGDMVRSAACPLPEDTTDLDAVAVVPALLTALTEGYVGQVESFLRDAERQSLVQAGRIATFDQAMRFLADHLAGDQYFRARRPDHNLDRCRVQLRLLSSLATTEDLVEKAIAAAPPGGHR